MNTTPASAPAYVRATGGIMDKLRRAEAWMDSKGRGAWIAAMVAGFIAAPPVGLALVAYITLTNRWSKHMFKSSSCAARREQHWANRGTWRSSGNTAFDAYKVDTLRRLEDEQQAFEAFLQRLRDAKDKAEFDSFMEDRAKGNRASSEDNPRGEY